MKEQLAKKITDLLVLNGAIPPGMNPPTAEDRPLPAYLCEGAYLVILNAQNR